MLLTVELQKEGDVLEVFCDEEGLDSLLHQLQLLRSSGGHLHLMTPAWGGDGLSEEKQVEENSLVHHVRIALRPPTWAAKTAQSG